MTDISKCSGKDCPFKESCYRYMSSDGEYQSYIMPPFKIVDGVFSCKLFWGEQAEGISNQLKSIIKE